MKKVIILIILILLLLNISLAQDEGCFEDAECTGNIYGEVCISESFCGCEDVNDCISAGAGKICSSQDNMCSCSSDADCTQGTCQEFTEQSYSWKECSESDSGEAQTLTTCLSSQECTNPGEPVCDTIIGECVECLEDADCTNSPYGSLCDTSSMLCIPDAAQQLSPPSSTQVPYENIDSEIKTILNIPKQQGYSVEMKQRISGIPTYFTSVNPGYLPSGITEEDVLIVNSEVDIRTSMKYFSYITPQSTQDLTLVKKQIKTGIKDYIIIEEIPLASALSDVYFTVKPEQASTNPFAVSITVKGKKDTEFYYITQGNAISKVSGIQTIIIPIKSQLRGKGSYKSSKCGDGMCTNFLEDKFSCPEDCKKKIRWGWIITLIILFLIGILFIKHRKKKKEKLMQTPFKSEKNEQILRAYVETALKSGKAKQDIRIILVNKGWTSQQIEHVFRKLGK